MNNNKYKKIKISISIIFIIFIGIWWYISQQVSIKSVILSSPNNLSCQEEIKIELDKPSELFVRYWLKNSKEKYIASGSGNATSHISNLLLLHSDTTYEYQIVIKGLINNTSKVFSFKTRKQSPWLNFNWVKPENPHDATSLGDGLVMICYGRLPGYIAFVDGKGEVRWYWQVNDIGVRAASLTPKGTIIAMLRPPKTDAIDDTPKNNSEILKELNVPMKRGSLGFAGGTAIAEIDLTGKLLWRIDIDKLENRDYKSIHHDVIMDKRGNVHTLYRPKKIIDFEQISGTGIDTLGGDGILVIDSKGKEIKKWNIWDYWDIKNDPYIKRFAYDRFHINSLAFDTDSNYLVSVAVEDQVWKINSKTGKIMWKFGKNGDFKIDTTALFSFQHSININSRGELMLFDNSIIKKESRAISFNLDTINMIAKSKIIAPLPKSKYTSRMGSAYLLPNGNLLQTSAKTGTIMTTTDKGEVLWQLNSYFVPYRAEYIPFEFCEKYIQKE